MSKKICVITGSRAEYGLLYPLLKQIKSDKFFSLHLVATGMHLSADFGFTYREIEKDGFIINDKVKMLLSNDSEEGISKSIGRGVIGFADLFRRLRPDAVIVLGDRFETYSAVISAFIARIPIIHLHGGELTQGLIDEGIRHSITKMAQLHFTAAKEYRNRVVQLGESPQRVFSVGALGLDNIKNLKLLSKKELEKELGFSFGQKTAFVTYHPVTLEPNTSGKQCRMLLSALDSFGDIKLIFTKPNADTHGRIISKLIEDYVDKRSDRCAVFSSLGKLRYLSCLKYIDLVIGNSSSGIIEVPSFNKPTVNIGDRQKGRIMAKSVIGCDCKKLDIERAVKKALSPGFIKACSKVKNPYGSGDVAVKIRDIIKRQMKKGVDVKKDFFDLPNKL